MEIRDGFIVGIFNYCDRRCEGCAFTSRCRLFAMMTRFEAQLDPNLRPVADAPSLHGEPGPGVPRAVLDLLDAIDGADDPLEPVDDPAPPTTSAPEGIALRARADAYRERVWTWLRERGDAGRHDPDDPLDIVTWSSAFIPGKVVGLLAIRELTLAWAHDDEDEAVADGSAKVVLLAIERAHAAWLALVDGQDLAMSVATPFIADLVWLHETLERQFPRARSFVRPAFDEPDAIAHLRTMDGGAP